MKSSRLSRVASAAFIVASLAMAPTVARADESAAEQLFQEGLAAMKRNDFPVACEAFASSNKADPSPGTQINLAVCYEKQKKWASAWTWYRSAVGLAQQRGQTQREKSAEEAAARLKPQLHYVVVSVNEPLTDLAVKRDGVEVTVAIAGKEVPLPVDPGEHAIEVSARAKLPWRKVIQVGDNNATDRIEVPKLQDAPVEPKAASPSTVPGKDMGPSPFVVTNDGSGQRTVGIVVGGTGLLAGLAGVGVFILAKGEESDRNKQRTAASNAPAGPDKDAFNKSAESHDKAAKNDQLIALILGGGAAVLLGVGATVFFTAPKPTQKAAKVVPLVSPTFAGLGVDATF